MIQSRAPDWVGVSLTHRRFGQLAPARPLGQFLTTVVAFLAGPLPASAAEADPTVAAVAESAAHGFAEVAVKTAYITPRGLVVVTDGATLQPLAGLALGLHEGDGLFERVSITTGVWNNLSTAQDSEYVGTWNEFDFFTGLSARLLRRLDVGATYVLFASPPHNFRPEHNVEFSLAFDDADFLRGAALHPYAKLFWAVAGDSVVLLGDEGGAFDTELGVAPGTTLGAAKVRLALPTFVTLGGPGFFGDGGVLGIVSTSLSASAPLAFVPGRFGDWQLSLAVAYFHLFNDSLVAASQALGNGGDRNRVVASTALGMGF